MRKLDKLGPVLAEGRSLLQEASIATAALDARLLLQKATGLEHGELLLNLDRFATQDELDLYTEYIVRRMRHEPVSRILGLRAFYGRDFLINQHVLDPRPDTETLIDLILHRFPKESELSVIDLGVGSGAIVLTLLAERPQWRGLGVDISPDALDVVTANAEVLHLEDRLEVYCGSWWSDVPGTFDLIVSNPPYIPKSEVRSLLPDVREYDPHLALVGGKDGLDCYRAIAAGAAEHLNPNGLVVLEIGHDQAGDVEIIWSQHNFKLIELRKDLAGVPRALAFTRA